MYTCNLNCNVWRQAHQVQHSCTLHSMPQCQSSRPGSFRGTKRQRWLRMALLTELSAGVWRAGSSWGAGLKSDGLVVRPRHVQRCVGLCPHSVRLEVDSCDLLLWVRHARITEERLRSFCVKHAVAHVVPQIYDVVHWWAEQ